MQISNIFYSKLLLYGEYTVTQGSGALALPYYGHAGSWSFGDISVANDKGLLKLFSFLEYDNTLRKLYNLDRFKRDISEGLVFTSNIPSGYGLGSSGALVAAFYDRYCIVPTNDLVQLKSILGATEGAFHGASSGLDPLVSYLDSGILIDESGLITKIDLDIQNDGYFLIDTGISRQTEHYVDIFKQKLKSSATFSTLVLLLAEENKTAINALLKKDINQLRQTTKNISKLQFEHFKEMIPPQFIELWNQGLQSGLYSLKLCGAGGGGMILGLCSDVETNIDFGPNIKTSRI